MTRPMQTSAGPVDLKTIDAFDVLGPTVKFLTPFTGSDEAPCIIHGVDSAGWNRAAAHAPRSGDLRVPVGQGGRLV